MGKNYEQSVSLCGKNHKHIINCQPLHEVDQFTDSLSLTNLLSGKNQAKIHCQTVSWTSQDRRTEEVKTNHISLSVSVCVKSQCSWSFLYLYPSWYWIYIYPVVILLHELINWNQGVWHDREFFQPESEEEIKEIKKPKSYSTTIGRNYVLVGQTPPAIRM